MWSRVFWWISSPVLTGFYVQLGVDARISTFLLLWQAVLKLEISKNGVLLRIKVDGGIDVKAFAVGRKFALHVKYRIAFFDSQEFPDFVIRLNGFQLLFTSFNFNLVAVAQNFKQRFVFKRPAGKSRKVDVGNVVDVVKNRVFVHKAEPFHIDAPKIFFGF